MPTTPLHGTASSLGGISGQGVPQGARGTQQNPTELSVPGQQPGQLVRARLSWHSSTSASRRIFGLCTALAVYCYLVIWKGEALSE